jgi:multimeric flavodoxin WrbA
MKNIVIITASPRAGGNTALLADAFKESAAGAGHQVTIFDAAAKNVGPCMACGECYKTGKACAHDAAFNELAPLIENADALVFATPLYFGTVSAQMKAAIDHLYALLSTGKLKHVREAALLAAGASPESAFSVLQTTYKHIVEGQNWSDMGAVLAGGAAAPGDVKKTGALDKARELAKKF